MENSKIEWTHHTFNPWIGCTKVSDGCKNCYAEELMDKRYGRVKWGVQGLRVQTSESNWKQPVKWNKAAKEAGVRARVFCASLADVFEDKPDQPEMSDWRRDLFELIIKTPNLDWLLLTKRPENILGWIPEVDNLHFGVSIENQEQANQRVPALLELKNILKFNGLLFVSAEPLLGHVDLYRIKSGNPRYPLLDCLTGLQRREVDPELGLCAFNEDDYYSGNNYSINWVIAGGESGHHARPMHPDWARSLRDQCQAAGVPFLFKQWGECAPYDGAIAPIRWDDGTKMWRPGKKNAGRLLDGREWNEFPEVTHEHL